MTFHVPEACRVKNPPVKHLRSTKADGNNGFFRVRSLKYPGISFTVIASDGNGWDHVSVSLHNRCPTWAEMDYIKSVFWDEEDVVVQYHIGGKSKVNNHKYCLHLWRPQTVELPKPHKEMV